MTVERSYQFTSAAPPAKPVAVDTPGVRAAARPRAQVYWFHPDHLGTGTLITDLEGRPHQFFLNLPYGETFIEQGGYRYDNPYKFNGKELDEETGLYYYGARYYDPKISLWLSVDPLAGEYPGMSPYVYTYANPLKFIDPTGMEGEAWDDIIFKDKNGNEIYRIKEKWYQDFFGLLDTEIVLSDEELEKGGFFAYAVEEGGVTHSFVIDLQTGDYWEASHTLDENGEVKPVMDAVSDWYSSNGRIPKSVIRKRNIYDKKDPFWDINAGYEKRNDLDIHIVWVPDRSKAIEYANSHTGAYNYNLLTRNCKDWALSVLTAGGVKLDWTTRLSPVPSEFQYYVTPYRVTAGSFRINRMNWTRKLQYFKRK